MDSIIAVGQNVVPAAFVPVKILTSPIMPKGVQDIGYAVTKSPGHVKDLLAVERKSNGPSKNNLLSTLVRASDAESSDGTFDSKNKL